MDAEQSGRRLTRHRAGNGGAPVAALGDVAGVPEALHQLSPGASDAVGTPAPVLRTAREAVAGHRRDHEMEGVRCACAVRRGIGERIDDLQLLDDRAGPSVRHDERQRVLVLRADVDEVNVDSVDLGQEHGERVQPRLHLAPVVGGAPVAHHLLELPELRPLRSVVDGLLIRPAGRGDAPAEISELRFRNIDAEGADGITGGRGDQH